MYVVQWQWITMHFKTYLNSDIWRLDRPKWLLFVYDFCHHQRLLLSNKTNFVITVSDELELTLLISSYFFYFFFTSRNSPFFRCLRSIFHGILAHYFHFTQSLNFNTKSHINRPLTLCSRNTSNGPSTGEKGIFHHSTGECTTTKANNSHEKKFK